MEGVRCCLAMVAKPMIAGFCASAEHSTRPLPRLVRTARSRAMATSPTRPMWNIHDDRCRVELTRVRPTFQDRSTLRDASGRGSERITGFEHAVRQIQAAVAGLAQRSGAARFKPRGHRYKVGCQGMTRESAPAVIPDTSNVGGATRFVQLLDGSLLLSTDRDRN